MECLDIVWKSDKAIYEQNVFYLHGALHFFDHEGELEKINFKNTRKPLVERIREALDNQKIPLFVAEGNSDTKFKKIKHHIYLAHCYINFQKLMQNKKETLFIFGHSLEENDNHIIKEIGKGDIAKIFISIHSDEDSATSQYIFYKALALQEKRGAHNPLEIYFFDAATANVWGEINKMPKKRLELS